MMVGRGAREAACMYVGYHLPYLVPGMRYVVLCKDQFIGPWYYARKQATSSGRSRDERETRKRAIPRMDGE
jgi:hypothetical protein